MGMKASNAIATFFKYFVLILVGLIMIYPLLWMISATSVSYTHLTLPTN